MEKFEKNKTFQAAAVIDYADGSIVSKELVHNPAGTITLFAFDTGQGLSEHTAPFDALIQVAEGEMELTIDGTKHTISAGSSFVIPSGALHSVNAARRFKMLITMIRG